MVRKHKRQQDADGAKGVLTKRKKQLDEDDQKVETEMLGEDKKEHISEGNQGDSPGNEKEECEGEDSQESSEEESEGEFPEWIAQDSKEVIRQKKLSELTFQESFKREYPPPFLVREQVLYRPYHPHPTEEPKLETDPPKVLINQYNTLDECGVQAIVSLNAQPGGSTVMQYAFNSSEPRKGRYDLNSVSEVRRATIDYIMLPITAVLQNLFPRLHFRKGGPRNVDLYLCNENNPTIAILQFKPCGTIHRADFLSSAVHDRRYFELYGRFDPVEFSRRREQILGVFRRAVNHAEQYEHPRTLLKHNAIVFGKQAAQAAKEGKTPYVILFDWKTMVFLEFHEYRKQHLEKKEEHESRMKEEQQGKQGQEHPYKDMVKCTIVEQCTTITYEKYDSNYTTHWSKCLRKCLLGFFYKAYKDVIEDERVLLPSANKPWLLLDR